MAGRRRVTLTGSEAITGIDAQLRKKVIYGVPLAATISRITTDANSLTVSVTPPTEAGGSPIKGYKVEVRSANAVVATAFSAQPSITVSGLTSGSTYTVSAAARNSSGAGPMSTPVSVTIRDENDPPTVPTAPLAVSAVPTNISGQIGLAGRHLSTTGARR